MKKDLAVVNAVISEYGLDFQEMLDVFNNSSVKSGDDYEKVEPPWMTRQEAAQYCRVSIDTVDIWLKKGYFNHIKTSNCRPGAVRIDRKSFIDFLNSRTVMRLKKRAER